MRMTWAAATIAAGLIASTPLAAQPSTTTYIHAGRLLDQPGREPRGQSTIIVRDGKIAEVRDGFAAPEGGARVIDLTNAFVLPGLIDMHVHISSDDNLLRSRLESSGRDVEDVFVIAQDNARKTLEAGFTTVRDLGGDGRTACAADFPAGAGRGSCGRLRAAAVPVHVRACGSRVIGA